MSDTYLPHEKILSAGQELLAAEPSLDAPSLALRLRKSFPTADPADIAFAVETLRARKLAKDKLGNWSQQGLFTVSLLEQASRSVIAEHRAQYFQGKSHILEIGTGTASDTAALARVSAHVTSIELDTHRRDLAKHNLSVQGISNVTLLVGNACEVVQSLDLSQFDGLFADPARRRIDGVRVRDSEDYSPPLSWLLELPVGSTRAIKVSPGLFFDAPSKGWSRQFIGYGAECLEQTLWLDARIPDSSVFLADERCEWHPSNSEASPRFARGLEGYIVEAHGAINRSQHVGRFFAEQGIEQISPDVAYGISGTRPEPSPFLAVFPIIDAFPYNLKRLKNFTRERGWTNRTEIKKRNFTGDIEDLRANLKLAGHSHNAPYGTIFFFKNDSQTWVVVAEKRCA